MATNKDAPFGMRAIGKVGQNNDNQGLSEYNIAASAPAIFQNDAVKAIKNFRRLLISSWRRWQS